MPGRMAITGLVIGTVIGLLIISPFGLSSGGHFNPAVTVTLWLLRSLPGATPSSTLPPSWLARWPA
jgi:glycerol uptake facilitator-like aquaporin